MCNGGESGIRTSGFSPKKLSDTAADAACWQLAGVLPVGELKRYDLLWPQYVEELIAQTHGIVATAPGTLRAMLASDQGESIGPGVFLVCAGDCA